jgi:23S rRNA pseudouridine1911/1915/1917 synthase
MPAEGLRAEPGRLDAIVAKLTGASRADVQRAIEDGLVRVDGEHRPRSFRLLGGERIEADLPGEPPIPAEGPPVPIRLRDDHLLVIAKPPGLPTHPTAARRTGTLVNRLRGMGLPLSSIGGPMRPGIVHRLDAGTSGLMIVALSDDVHVALAAMFRRHEVDRRYLALVRGAPVHDSFDVEAPLGRRGARVRVQAANGRHAETAFEVRERFADAALVEARPRTGRTHQIRVHLTAVGHPIVGDRTYGGGGDLARRLELGRPFLHSWRLAFSHPLTGERVEVEEPLFRDLAEALERLSPRGSSRSDRPSGLRP